MRKIAKKKFSKKMFKQLAVDSDKSMSLVKTESRKSHMDIRVVKSELWNLLLTVQKLINMINKEN